MKDTGITTQDLRTAAKVLTAVGAQMVQIESEWPWWRRLLQTTQAKQMFYTAGKMAEMAEMFERRAEFD